MPGVRPLNVSCVRVKLIMLAKVLSVALFFCLTMNAVARQAPSGGTGKLVGMVSDTLGLYVPNASIIIKGKRMKRELLSGNDGTYSVDLPPGTYSVRFKPPGFLPVRKRVQITRDGVTKLDVVVHSDTRGSVTVY